MPETVRQEEVFVNIEASEGEASEKSRLQRVKAPLASIPKTHRGRAGVWTCEIVGGHQPVGVQYLGFCQKFEERCALQRSESEPKPGKKPGIAGTSLALCTYAMLK